MPDGDSEITGRWTLVDSLVEGDHVHLDALVDPAPDPGSRAWLPVIDDLARYLVGAGGRWLITLRLGECDEVPTGPVDAERAFNLADASELLEPPAVYRLHAANSANRWIGERHRWTRAASADVTEEISVTRSLVESQADERFGVSLAYEI